MPAVMGLTKNEALQQMLTVQFPSLDLPPVDQTNCIPDIPLYSNLAQKILKVNDTNLTNRSLTDIMPIIHAGLGDANPKVCIGVTPLCM